MTILARPRPGHEQLAIEGAYRGRHRHSVYDQSPMASYFLVGVIEHPTVANPI
jgi:hypothetical protein